MRSRLINPFVLDCCQYGLIFSNNSLPYFTHGFWGTKLAFPVPESGLGVKSIKQQILLGFGRIKEAETDWEKREQNGGHRKKLGKFEQVTGSRVASSIHMTAGDEMIELER